MSKGIDRTRLMLRTVEMNAEGVRLQRQDKLIPSADAAPSENLNERGLRTRSWLFAGVLALFATALLLLILFVDRL